MGPYPNNKYGDTYLGMFDYWHKHPPGPFNPSFNPLAKEWRKKASEKVAKMEPFKSREARRIAWADAYEQERRIHRNGQT